MTTAIRVSDICAHHLLVDAILVGVDAPTGKEVVAVDLINSSRVLEDPLTEGAAAVLAFDTSTDAFGDHLIDVAVRRCGNARSSMLVVVGTSRPLATSTRRLAEQLRFPVVVASDVSPIDVVVELRTLVARPGQDKAQLALELARRLPRTSRELEEIVRLLADVLPESNVYACAGRDQMLTGTAEMLPSENVVALSKLGTIQHEDAGATVLPIEAIAGGKTALWLVAERRRPGPHWHELAALALQLASGAVVAWLASEHASVSHDARWRSTLLSEIIEQGPSLSQDAAEHAARAGWRLDGWHTGIHIRCEPSTQSPLALRSIVQQLDQVGLRASSIIDRTDGWSTWITSVGEPRPAEIKELARTIRHDLRQPPPGHTIVVGIGSPRRDVSGIAPTLAGARQAALLGTSSGRSVSVRVLDDLGPARLLLGWYSSEAFADYADELLAPLAGVDHELIETLEVYLESACSSAAAARKLAVHRNTVAKRIARIERTLGTTLFNGDTRLALQLALRVRQADHPDR